MTTDTASQTASPAPYKPSPLRRGIIAAGLFAGGIVVGAGGLAFAAGDMPWHGHGHHGPRVGMIQHVVRGALDNVGATTAQEDKIHDIIATTYTELDKGGAEREAMRKQILELLKAPTIDSAAIEKLRAEKIGEMDAKSKTIVGALLDAAGQLSPEQRAKLAEHAEERMAQGGWGHGGWGGWRHRDRMNGSDGQDGGRQHGDHGPDDGDHG